MTYRYDPELAPIAELLPDLDITDIAAARALMDQMRAQLPAFVAPESLTVDTRRVPGPDGAPDVELRILTPKGATAPLPALYWMHGGGFVFGDVDMDLAALAPLAEGLQAVVVSVEYRLAPEHPFPAAVDDSYAGLVWVTEHAEELGVDPTRIAVGGQSAGGGLAAAMALLARDRNGPELCFQLLDIPVLDDTLSTPSVRSYVDTPLWNHRNAVVSWRSYLGTETNGDTSAYAAPARATDLSGLPPAFVSTCEFDPLRDEGIDFAQRLVQAGIPTELHLYPGTFHGASGVGIGTEVAARMNGDLVAALGRAFTS